MKKKEKSVTKIQHVPYTSINIFQLFTCTHNEKRRGFNSLSTLALINLLNELILYNHDGRSDTLCSIECRLFARDALSSISIYERKRRKRVREREKKINKEFNIKLCIWITFTDPSTGNSIENTHMHKNQAFHNFLNIFYGCHENRNRFFKAADEH